MSSKSLKGFLEIKWKSLKKISNALQSYWKLSDKVKYPQKGPTGA